MRNVQLKPAERADLYYVLARYKGAAKRLLSAIDENRLTPDTYGMRPLEGGPVCACVYGHGVGNAERGQNAANRRGTVDDGTIRLWTPIEAYLFRHRGRSQCSISWCDSVNPSAKAELKAEITAWLAEHGTYPEPTPEVSHAVHA